MDEFVLKMWKWLWNWVINRGWKGCEVHARKSPCCHEWTIKPSYLLPSSKAQSSEKYPSGCEQNTSGNTDGKGHSDEVSHGNEKHVIGQWRKHHLS
jgi:hypothetical protein